MRIVSKSQQASAASLTENIVEKVPDKLFSITYTVL